MTDEDISKLPPWEKDRRLHKAAADYVAGRISSDEYQVQKRLYMPNLREFFAALLRRDDPQDRATELPTP